MPYFSAPCWLQVKACSSHFFCSSSHLPTCLVADIPGAFLPPRLCPSVHLAELWLTLPDQIQRLPSLWSLFSFTFFPLRYNNIVYRAQILRVQLDDLWQPRVPRAPRSMHGALSPHRIPPTITLPSARGNHWSDLSCFVHLTSEINSIWSLFLCLPSFIQHKLSETDPCYCAYT